ncbi:MAG: putative membrane protein [Candidatus Magasanikbacteria bacterium GW2011_GWA2_46_17]|uniref:Putative membrane protein n=1 Tax=Candidatus Magasanikbacteria bacterium GW2011_GWA2_46_17 TaxID=1619042 RepID=A0A0G1RYM3_9BACT|nr:MAG: putative membrane protein [Candidatus Magasanikbacteria bacterium GW2011_GWA2_46_17]
MLIINANMRLVFRWLLSALALLFIAYYIPGIRVESFYTALVAALVLGLANALIRPILLVLTLPVTILTLGLFTFVINALLFWFVSTLVKGFDVAGFWPAFFGALIMWVVGWISNRIAD